MEFFDTTDYVYEDARSIIAAFDKIQTAFSDFSIASSNIRSFLESPQTKSRARLTVGSMYAYSDYQRVRPSHLCDFSTLDRERLPLTITQDRLEWDDALEDLPEFLEPFCVNMSYGFPQDGLCTEDLVCAAGNTRAFYVDHAAHDVSYGTCKQAETPIEALDYAFSHGVVGPTSALDWPYTLHESLWKTGSSAADWGRFWRTVIEKSSLLYLDWTDHNGVRMALFRSGPRITHPDADPTGTRLWFTDGSQEALYVCPLTTNGDSSLPVNTLAFVDAISFDDNGDAVDLLPFWTAVKQACSSTIMDHEFAQGYACPATAESPFVCVESLTCVPDTSSDRPSMGRCAQDGN